MRTKTAYREKPTPNIPPAAEITAQSAPADTEMPANEPEPIPGHEPEPVAAQAPPEPLDPTAALLRQIEASKKSQEMLAQHYAQMKAPQSREYAVALMVQGGATEVEANFFIDHPAMIENPKALLKTAAEAHEAGIERDSPQYFEFLEQGFNRRLEKVQHKAAMKAASQPTPEFFKREAPPPEETLQNSAAIYSAPVSHEVPTGGYREPSPSQVRLSPEEKEVAKSTGISETEYARQKLRMMRAQESGQIQK